MCVCVCRRLRRHPVTHNDTHTNTHTWLKRSKKKKRKRKEGKWENWLVMWGNSNLIIPNNSLSQRTSSALIPQNPPRLIPDRLADILSFIYRTFPPSISPLVCFNSGWSVLLNTEDVSLICACFERVCVRMCVCCLVYLRPVRTNSRPEMLWIIIVE